MANALVLISILKYTITVFKGAKPINCILKSDLSTHRGGGGDTNMLRSHLTPLVLSGRSFQ